MESLNLLKIFKEGFSFRVFVLNTLFIMIISSSFTIFFILQQRKALTDNLIKKGEMIAQLLAHNSRLGVFAENEELLVNSMEGFLQYDEVMSLLIFTPEGKLLIKQQRQGSKTQGKGMEADQRKLRDIIERIKKSKSSFYLEAADTFEFWAPVISGSSYFIEEPTFFDKNSFRTDRIIGFVGVALDKGLLNKQLKSILFKGILIGIIFLMIASVATYQMVKRITKPLNKLTESVKALGRGVTVEEVPVETKDEIGRLASTFNTMVTERKQAEKALRESEERFRAIFNSAQDCIFIKDRSLKYWHVNPSIERLFGVRASELVGKTDEELFGEEAGKYIREVDSQALKGEIVEGEHTKPVKGVLRTFHHIKVPLRNSKGESLVFVG